MGELNIIIKSRDTQFIISCKNIITSCMNSNFSNAYPLIDLQSSIFTISIGRYYPLIHPSIFSNAYPIYSFIHPPVYQKKKKNNSVFGSKLKPLLGAKVNWFSAIANPNKIKSKDLVHHFNTYLDS